MRAPVVRRSSRPRRPIAMGGLLVLLLALCALLAAGCEDTASYPLCRNYAGTANDSGYPCRIDHSDGSVEIVHGP